MTLDRTAAASATRRALLFTGLSVALVLMVLVSAGSGQVAITPGGVLASIGRALGFDSGGGADTAMTDATLWTIRFPRIVMALLIGAALASAGTLMQAIFGNPLAEPSVVGVSSGAALGASLSIVLGWTFLGEWTIAVTAFAAGLITTLVIYLSSRSNGRTEIVTLVLTGIAVNAVAGAGLALLTFLGDTSAREQIIFWQLGSLNGSRWEQVGVVLPLIVVGLIVAFLLARTLDLFALGERSARHLGVNVELVRIIIIVVVALLVCAAVSFAGIIGFVGLVVPHLMRMIIGPAHLPLLTASAIGGALLLVTADLVARTAVPMADLPIGMLTSLVGGPFFFWLLRRTRRREGGWA
ncbi:FecCD family ABC transporter permease [Glaciibacter psychrotolerans]|uniref:Iron complex transport system permease protein n=1 Tax=Glaciibacter psychrotolerans TaxID=670054 RepID=A0A7Z0EGY1_9MICO|nr:iron complex transport system permease protein [Leifsonia psychrotolerans]